MTSNAKSSMILATGALLLANTSGAAARRCYYDRYNRYRCTGGLASAARIGIGIGIAVLALLILGCLLCLFIMRRRKARGHMVALPPPATSGSGPTQYEKPAQHQDGSYQPYPSSSPEYYPNQAGGANYESAGPQFPEPSYQPAGGYTPPSGPPPNTNYAPPAGPPPGK